jgi:hypothetical protein
MKEVFTFIRLNLMFYLLYEFDWLAANQVKKSSESLQIVVRVAEVKIFGVKKFDSAEH